MSTTTEAEADPRTADEPCNYHREGENHTHNPLCPVVDWVSYTTYCW